MEEIRKINKDYRIVIEHDYFCESPDSCEDEELFLIFNHKQFNVERKGFEVENINDYLQIKQRVKELEKNSPNNINLEDLRDDLTGYFDYEFEYHIFHVSAYIHSGVSLSLNTLYPFQCPWDSSHNGFILVKRDILKDSSKNEENLTWEEAQKYAKGLIENWNEWLRNEVYYIELQKIKQFQKHYLDGEIDYTIKEEFVTIDSLGGIYKNDLEECINNILQENNIIKDETTKK